MVHDIDIVCLPSDRAGLEHRLWELMEQESLREVRNGPLIKTFLAVASGISIDLYIAEEATWATLLLIRTGSKEHNIKLCRRARELGMKLHASGKGIETELCQPLRIDSEEQVFATLGLPFVAPEGRG